MDLGSTCDQSTWIDVRDNARDRNSRVRISGTIVVKRAVVLLSGGMDSVSALAVAQSKGFDIYALSFWYGQRHEIELKHARWFADHMNVSDHMIVNIDLRVFGGSALTSSIDVPKHDRVSQIESGIPVTYVPARNTIFLSYALAYAETIGSADIFLGVNSMDREGYPDCRLEYVRAFESMARFATGVGIDGASVTIHTPLIDMNKTDILSLAVGLGIDVGRTFSCYDPSIAGLACRRCDSCLLRLDAFKSLGITDLCHYSM